MRRFGENSARRRQRDGTGENRARPPLVRESKATGLGRGET